jgi:hypothetical protein
MAERSSLEEYKALVVGLLRDVELRNAGSDRHKLEKLKHLSDDDLLSKWLWLASIVGGIAFFLVLPATFGMLAMVIPFFIMQIFWTLLKLGMGMVVIVLVLAIYFTVRRSTA